MGQIHPAVRVAAHRVAAHRSCYWTHGEPGWVCMIRVSGDLTSVTKYHVICCSLCDKSRL